MQNFHSLLYLACLRTFPAKILLYQNINNYFLLSYNSYCLKLMNQKKYKSKIGHSLEELEDGLILTLQDQPILQGNHLNQCEDVYENYQRRKLNETQHNRQIKQKLKTISNAATSHLQAKNEGQKELLPHYNDYSYKAEEVDIEEGGIVGKRSRPKPKIGVASDFDTSNQQSTTSEYSTKKFKNRKHEKTNTSQLLDFLNQTAFEKDEQNIGVKSAEDIIKESVDTVRKRRKLQKQSNSQDNFILNEDEELLAKAIKKTRQKQQHSALLDIIKEESEEKDPQQKQKYTEIQLNPVTYKPLSKEQEANKKFQIQDVMKGTTSCLFMNLPSQKLAKKEQAQLPQNFKDITEEELQKMREQVSFLEDRSLGLGLADTLKFLRENNMLGKEEQFGKTKDKDGIVNDPNDRIKLEYRNSSGKLMKPKQAFRYLSSIFHGKGPGKNKIEKMKRKQILEMQMKEAASKNEGKLLNLLEKHQQKTGQAHMVIDFGAKNKQQ